MSAVRRMHRIPFFKIVIRIDTVNSFTEESASDSGKPLATHDLSNTTANAAYCAGRMTLLDFLVPETLPARHKCDLAINGEV